MLEDKGSEQTTQDNLMEELSDFVLEIDHIALAVPNLEDAVNWYVSKLGFRLQERRTTMGLHSGMRSAVLRAGKSIVVLTEGTSPESQVSQFIKHFGMGVTHVALRVRDLYEAVEHLERHGGKADTPIIEDVGIKQVFLRRESGSGVRVELIEQNGGTFTDRSVDRLFRSFEERDLY